MEYFAGANTRKGVYAIFDDGAIIYDRKNKDKYMAEIVEVLDDGLTETTK